MRKEHTSGSLASSIEISNLVRAYGITRDQARRLVGRIGKNRAKLDQAARILKARCHHDLSQRRNNEPLG